MATYYPQDHREEQWLDINEEKARSVDAGATPSDQGATESAHDLRSEVARLREELETAKAAVLFPGLTAGLVVNVTNENRALRADASRLRGALKTLAGKWRKVGQRQQSRYADDCYAAQCAANHSCADDLEAALASSEAGTTTTQEDVTRSEGLGVDPPPQHAATDRGTS